MRSRWHLLGLLLVLLVALAVSTAQADGLYFSWQTPSTSFTYSSGCWPIYTQPRPVVIYEWIAPARPAFGWGPIYNWYGCGAPPLTYVLPPVSPNYGPGWWGHQYGWDRPYRYLTQWPARPETVIIVNQDRATDPTDKDEEKEK